MKYSKIKYENEKGIIEVLVKKQNELDNMNNEPVLLFYSNKLNSYIVKSSKKHILVEPKDKKNNDLIYDLISVNTPFITIITKYIENKNETILLIEYYKFNRKIEFDDKLSIEVDDKIFKEIELKYLPTLKNLSTNESKDKCYKFLKDEFWLKKVDDNKNQYIFLSKGVNDDLKNSDENESFRLYGDKIIADIGNINGKFILQRITQNRYFSENSKENIIIAVCEMEFTDTATDIRRNSKKQLEELSKAGESLLDSWRIYNKIEKEELDEKIINIGCFEYDSFWVENDNYILKILEKDNIGEKLKNTKKYLDNRDPLNLSIADVIPEEIGLLLSNSDEKVENKTFFKNNIMINPIKYKIDLTNLTIKFTLKDNEEKKIPEIGYIFYSYIGDKVANERRKKAHDNIFTSKNPMPQLAQILEGISTVDVRVKKIKAISSKLRKKMESQPPTKSQLEAIKVALNTPDIAIIQGPPGTGKTTVITAIIERLAEEVEKTSIQKLNDLVLVSSFQHDAVENATDRIKINGIPAIKLGGKDKDIISASRRITNKWIEEQEVILSSKLEALPPDSIYKKLRLKVNSYLQTPGNSIQTFDLLKGIKNDINGRNLISNKLMSLLTKEIVNMENESKTKGSRDTRLIKLIRGLRIHKVSFADDGFVKSYNLLKYMESRDIISILHKEELNILKRSLEHSFPESPKFLKDLELLKENLLDRCIPSKKSSFDYMENKNISILLTDILDEVNQKLLKTKTGEASILAEYLDDIQFDPQGVMEMLAHYTSVLAASCQQADSSKMQKIKNNDLIYDTVIIDEAARATPLDLLIPMAQAKRRIILVGDHRQLPHIVEDSILAKMENSISENTENDINIEEKLKESLFEKLFKNLKELERTTGVKRCVTLDKQFRTTPVLGDFVSKNFYECHNEPHIESGMPIERLQHNLQNYNSKSVAWIDVPLIAGKEQSGQSKSRLVEAKIIAKEINNLITENSKLTYGVITFYAAQRDLIKEEIIKMGINLEDLENDDKLRIGSIDAFQGREFDVVLLSITRSNDFKSNTEKDSRKKYGFMTFPNRLCVAMSRQKKLLVAVGDSKMFETAVAQVAIPQMYEFNKLCKGEEGVFRNYKEVL